MTIQDPGCRYHVYTAVRVQLNQPVDFGSPFKSGGSTGGGELTYLNLMYYKKILKINNFHYQSLTAMSKKISQGKTFYNPPPPQKKKNKILDPSLMFNTHPRAYVTDMYMIILYTHSGIHL
jgi:hypothetical protein